VTQGVSEPYEGETQLKLQFDADQQFQINAVAAIADLFEGQPQGTPEYAIINVRGMGGLFAGQEQTELGVGNHLLLDQDSLLANTRAVQAHNEIEIAEPTAPLEGWELFDGPANVSRHCPHFSVEMETGTGKTYVYLRTIFELSLRYGFQKFIIVVPSVAIREGVLKNIEITADHFRALYNNLPCEHFVYDAKKVNRLRQFATSNTLQIAIINIQAFNKKDVAVIYKESDKLSGRQPIEFVQAARPIVVIDEPQSVEGGEEGAGLAALKQLNPLCTLRYSATHRNPYSLVYRLDPIRAFELKLVKQIVVGSAKAEGAANDAFVRVETIDYKKGIKAKLRIQVQTPQGPKEKSVTVKQGADLFILSDERATYKAGFEVTEINAEPGREHIRFSNGRTLRLGEEIGGLREDVWRFQIKETIKRHLEKELQIRESAGERGIKVLSLFFIDRVANYRDYDGEGKQVRGKFAEVFEAELINWKKDQRFKDISWLKEPVEKLHDGYFAQDRKGIYKDSREGGDSQDDEAIYDKIMKNKEQLLSLDEPLRFIFSHSALREGWDNPNVFQICTLSAARSPIKKRQEIGRGLRLPVDQDGLRVFDDSINKLYVMANESYEDFAKALQNEYENDCGVTFGKISVAAIAKLTRVVDGEEKAIGRDAAAVIQAALVEQKMLDNDGRLQPAFDPGRPDFKVELPEDQKDLAPAVVDLLASFQIERHVRRDRDEGTNRLRKEVSLSPEFAQLWKRIKSKTTYRVEFATDVLVQRSVYALKQMERIEKPRVSLVAGRLGIEKGGVTAEAVSVTEEKVLYGGPVPDLLAYLQNETELTRSTLVRVLKESGKLSEFFNNPQRFMDAVATILKNELHRLLVDGIKYERIPGEGSVAEWEMLLFKDEELINYLKALQVEKSLYEYVVYDSEIERQFAKRLNEREDIKLFVKLPNWFLVDTPIGKYNPDWAILLERDGLALYLVRETKGTRDYLKLRTSEADKVRCGQKHFDAIGVPFAVVVSAEDV
jgi:type III restriction enzyme